MLGFIFFAFILLFLSHLSLRERVVRLENKRGSTDTTEEDTSHHFSPLPPPQETESFTVDGAHRLTPTFSVEEANRSPQSVPKWSVSQRSVIRWFRDHTLIKVGSILFFLGVAWFVGHVVNENLISPGLQITIGFLLASVAYTVAYNRSDISSTYYGILTALGTSIMVITAISGAVVFSLYPPLLALLLAGGGVAYTVFVATKIEAEWLVVLAALIGLATPFFTGMSDAPLLVLLYLFVLTIGLLLPGQERAWRVVPLVLIVGVSWFEVSLLGIAPRLVEWVFVVLFSLLFFVAVTASLIQARDLNRLSVTTLIITAVTYGAFAYLLAKSPALAVFGGTLVVVITLFVLYKERLTTAVIVAYLTLSVIGVLIGTSLLFSGGLLVSALAVLCTVAFFFATYYGLPEKFIFVVAGMYLVPVVLSFDSLLSVRWGDDLLTVEAVSTYAVSGMLWASTLWLIHKPGVALYQSSRIVITIFAVSGFFYMFAVSAAAMHSLFLGSVQYVMTYISWSLVSLITLFYVMRNDFPIWVMRTTALSILLPLLFSITSLTAEDWQFGVHHFSAFGVWSMVGVLCLIVLLITQQYCQEYDLPLRKINGFFIFVTTLFTFVVFRVTFDSLFPSAVANVVTYVSYAAVLYFLVSLFILVRSPQFWIRVATLSFLFPLLLSLGSFTVVGWPHGTALLHIAGLLAIGVFSVLLSFGIEQRLYLVAEKDTRVFLNRMSRFFWFTAVVLGAGVVWGVAHSVLPSVQAVSISLFVYTMSGLSAYLLGTQKRMEILRYTGVLLLTAVVVRLMIADVWYMEMVWRFVTLSGIGALFVGAALVERSVEVKKDLSR